MLAYLIAGIVALVMISGLAYKTYEAGGNAVRTEWAVANKKADDEQKAKLVNAAKTAKKSADDLAAAQRKGRDYEAKWRAERDKVSESSLASCPGSPTANATEAGKGSGTGTNLRFSYEFVRLWDHAWTGADGQPVFRHPATTDSTGAGSIVGSTVGPGQVIDNHQANAARCSEDRRALNALRAQIQKLEKGWK